MFFFVTYDRPLKEKKSMAESDAETVPGEMAMETAKQNVEIFKKPIHPAARKRKKVLDEDTYVREVEKIIERDFFPDLETLKEKLDYLEAKETNDVVRLREFYSKYSVAKDPPMLQNVEDSPATFETPITGRSKRGGSGTPSIDYSSDDPLDPQNKVMKNAAEDNDKSSQSGKMSLDEFLESHTSEDNESFEEIMKENERRFKIKHAWMFDAEEKHNKEHVPNLIPQTAQQQAEAAVLSITGTSVQNDTRPKQLENWNYQTFNSVMFVPDGAPLSQDKQIELAKQKKRQVDLANTRFDGNPFTETLSRAAMLEASAVQASKKEGKVGVDGKELGKDTPRVNGYSFVTAPSPVPGMDASPLMTWGEVEGTPFQLDGNQTPLLKKQTQGPSYRIPQVPNRDRLGHKLAEQASQKHRNKKIKAMLAAKYSLGTPSNKFGQQSSLERVTSMSPAAQRLLTTKLGIGQSTDKALRASYTPSPSIRHGSATPGAVTPSIAFLPTTGRSITPKLQIQKKATNAAGGIVEGELSLGLTDNLLNLPRRPKSASVQENNAENARKCASDFF
ncbi:splicing factor ESS-2 homolog isoform X1 [Procambarus clarkii]|uniref:splicing factor ESS-2 homolog isoform X1 n=2 Tax=Procambarus clarkii TaxID=6728 RepID=UPI003742438D